MFTRVYNGIWLITLHILKIIMCWVDIYFVTHLKMFHALIVILSVIVPLIFQIKKMFVKADRDGDGKLSKEEWFRVLNSTGYPTSMWVGCLVMEMHSWAGTGDTSWHLHCPTLNTGLNIQNQVSSSNFLLKIKWNWAQFYH